MPFVILSEAKNLRNDQRCFASLNMTASVRIAALQQIHLGVYRHCLSKTDANADEAHRFSRARKCFIEERTEVLQSWRKAGALRSSAREIVEF